MCCKYSDEWSIDKLCMTRDRRFVVSINRCPLFVFDATVTRSVWATIDADVGYVDPSDCRQKRYHQPPPEHIINIIISNNLEKENGLVFGVLEWNGGGGASQGFTITQSLWIWDWNCKNMCSWARIGKAFIKRADNRTRGTLFYEEPQTGKSRRRIARGIQLTTVRPVGRIRPSGGGCHTAHDTQFRGDFGERFISRFCTVSFVRFDSTKLFFCGNTLSLSSIGQSNYDCCLG